MTSARLWEGTAPVPPCVAADVASGACASVGVVGGGDIVGDVGPAGCVSVLGGDAGALVDSDPTCSPVNSRNEWHDSQNAAASAFWWPHFVQTITSHALSSFDRRRGSGSWTSNRDAAAGASA